MFTLTHAFDAATTRLVIAGELTIYEAREAHQALLAVLRDAAIDVTDIWQLDLAEIAEVDTAGVQLLLSLRNQLQRHGARLVLCNPAASVRDLHHQLRLADALPIADASACEV